MYDKMVTDNGHWNYCSSILRRKGRKRWHQEENTATIDRFSIPLKNSSNCHFFLGSRLLQLAVQQPREIMSKGFVRMVNGYGCCSVRPMLWFLLTFIFLNYSSLPSVSAATQDIRVAIPSSVTSSPPRVNRAGYLSNSRNGVCTSIDVRNRADAFNQLAGCRVIEGFLQIVLMDRTKEYEFRNLTFPELREITGYMLLYRISGLKSLAHLFPNLSIIRGHHLFMNYALAVYEMLDLEELGLYSLTDIPRGAVFITKNPLLCYIDTIDWNRITTNGKDLNFIYENRDINACPKCPYFNSSVCLYTNVTRQSHCWNPDHCQKTCPSNCTTNRCTATGDCCHDYCLGGCSNTQRDTCFACQSVYFPESNQCDDKCPKGYFKYKDRRCVTEHECQTMPRTREDMMGTLRLRPWKAFNGSCVTDCPSGFEEIAIPDGDENKIYKCQQCKGTCRKVCEGANVDSIQTAQRFKGCIVINGSLEIQIRGGGNIIKELEDNMNTIEEISGYLKVVRSLSLVSLNFLRSLKLIRGDLLENGKYVMVVLDNANLAELWDFSRRQNDMKVGKGRMFFHFNPKLCLSRIRELQDRLGITNVDELEVAPNSNGDKVACNITELYVSVVKTTPDSALITWMPYIHYEMRTLLGYVVYVMETTTRNVSVNDGRDACGIDGWKMFDVEIPDQTNASSSKDNVTHILTHLRPFTLYAFYVKTYTIATETNGAMSEIQYFTTSPSIPTPPRQLRTEAMSSSAIQLDWQAPEQINGRLSHYIITGEIAPDETFLINQKNYCSDPVDYDKKDLLKEKLREREKEREREEERKKLYSYSDGQCSCTNDNRQLKIYKNDQDVQALIEFENKLHDSIYVKNVNNVALSRNRRDTNMHLNMNKGMEFRLESTEYGNSTDMPKVKSSNETAKTNTSKFRIQVNSTTSKWEIKNLKHFTRYAISVQACRDKADDPLAEDFLSVCSLEKIDYVQTLALESADKIDPTTVEVEVLNDTKSSARLKWLDPNITNGPILTYLIQYKRTDVDNIQATTQCISARELDLLNPKVYYLKGIPPGNYSGMIKATTMAKDTNTAFIPMFHFLIRETEVTMLQQLLLGGLFAVCIIILIMFILFIMLRYFYPDSWYHRKLLFATVNPEYFKPIEGYDKWEISRRKVVLDNLLGIGHFGEVYEGRAKGIIQKGITTKVAIKTLNKSPTSHRTWMNFLNEASVMKQFDTHHVVRLLGVVTKGEPLVIMELMAKGDLRTYLRSCRADVPEEERRGPLNPPPTLKEILQMSAEISDGMLYLADKKFVHRDLAARNCMINAEGTVKIGDFGLTRDVYETDYYRKDSKGHLPVRWMAPESLRDGIFTSRSDVWSYGVVLWEMSTLASLPYTGLGNGEVMPYVINGGVMEEPENCPAILSELMRACWQYKYIQRPSFSEILELLLPNIREGFEEVSYYHTEEAKQLRASNAEAVAEDDTPYTPLRIMEDFEDFSLDSDENDDENDVDNTEPRTLNEANTSSANVSVRSLPTVNGYIRRPHHNLIPLVNTKTTPC